MPSSSTTTTNTTTTAPRQLSAAELLKHPEYPHVIWPLEPSQKGKLKCAGGGKYNISYEVHGTGPRHLVLIMGLGEFKTSWMRTTKDFGHSQGDKYSVLIIDNIGVGESDKPLFRYSTSGMARDVAAVLDHIGWTGRRSVHVCGISMGGMIAQELAAMAPERIASLCLCSTAARLINDASFWDNMKLRLELIRPKTIDEHIERQKRFCYTRDVLARPDDEECAVTPFPTMGDRLGAMELNKRSSGKMFRKGGVVCQGLACLGHRKTAEQLRALADGVGRRRILVVHGTADATLALPHGEVLVEELSRGAGAGEGGGVRKAFWEGQNHVIPVERRQEFNKALEELMVSCDEMNDG